MENKSKQNQQKQIEFLTELFGKSSFAKRWSFSSETRKSWSTDSKYTDTRVINVSVRPLNEEETKELNEIEQKIAEKGQSEPEVFEFFQELEINRGLGVGEKFPHYTKLTDVLKETEVEIKHQEGEVILLDVWATWCGPCQRPMQHNQDMLVKNAEKWAGKVKIVAVSVDDGREEVLKRINDKNWDKITHYKLNGWDGSHPIIKDFSIRGIPFVALVDTHGVLNFSGHPSDCNLEERINGLIEGKGSSSASSTQMTQEQYKLTKKFISTQLQEYINAQDSKEFSFIYSLNANKKTEWKPDSKVKTYEFPTSTAIVQKSLVPGYNKLKTHVTASLVNIPVKVEREQIKDIQAELKKDLEALAKIYEKHNLKHLENKHCATLCLALKGGKLVYERNDHFNQHKKLAVKAEEKQNVELAADEQREFAIGKYRSGQYADYLEQMFHKSIKSCDAQVEKPKSYEDVYRKFKDILQSKEIQELHFNLNLSYETKFKIFIKRKRVFDYKGQMKYKYYGQPKCKYVIRSCDQQKFQTEFLDKIFAKLDKNQIIQKPDVLKVVQIEEGKNCKVCNAELAVPYYFNYFKKEHYCLPCGDKRDETIKTLKQFAIPHNLILVNTTDKATLNEVDEYKIGKDTQPGPEEEIEFEFGYGCNGCHEGGKNTRYICLHCRPGPRRNGGYVDFCYECIKKQVIDKDEEFMKSIQKNDTEHTFNHCYIKIITPQGQYNDY